MNLIENDDLRWKHFTGSDRFDQVASDPEFRSVPLSEFEPMVQRVFEQPKSSIYLTD